MTPLTAEQVEKLMRRVRRMFTDGYIDKPECNQIERLGASHEAMRAEWELYRSLALRYADMWQPQFPLDPNEGLWVFPWADDVPDEAMTPEQVEFYRKRREART